MGRKVVFDTETATAGALIWNIAAIEIDTDTNTRKTLVNAVNATYLQHSAMSGAMFAPNEEKRETVNGAEQMSVNKFLTAIRELIYYCNREQLEMNAYNVTFDIMAIRKTAEFYGWEFPEIQHSHCLYREWQKKATAEYFLWALANSKFTDNGNPRMNAETAYQFLTRDADFVESHTALEDVDIECDILLALEKMPEIDNREVKNLAKSVWQVME